MLNFTKVPVFLYKSVIDGRAGIPTLCSYVSAAHRNPSDGSLYVFANKTRKILKAIYYDGVSYWMVQRKLNHGTHQWKLKGEGEVIAINSEELENLLKGLPIQKICQFKEEYPEKY